jgi:hypothetical protein
VRTYGLVALVATVAIGIPAGCGGGGGGSSTAPGQELFTGIYSVAGLSGTDIPPLEVIGAWGTAEADGVSEVQLVVTQNELGTITGPLPPDAAEFSVGLDRTLAFRVPQFPFLDILTGGITADGEVAALANTAFGGTAIYLFARTGGTGSDASLLGPYHICGYSYDDVVAVQTGWVGVVLFDGSGGGTLSAGLNHNGTVSPFGPISVSYGVAADGVVSLDLGSMITLTGRLAAGGDVVIASGSTTATGPPALFALLRAGTSMTNAAFDGTYHTVGFARDMSTFEHRCLSGATVSDGAGGFAWFVQSKEETGPVTLESDGGLYNILTNGTLFASTPTDELRGAVTPNGNFAVLGRISGVSPDPTFWFLFR